MTFEDMCKSLDMNNDLISRKYLKTLIDYACSWPSETDGIAHAIYTWANKIVDECPSVEPEKAKESELVKAYTKGFDAGVETVKNERPQGKWLTENLDKPYGRCNICGEICEIDNFCGNCGAKMNKGGFG